MKKLSGTQLLLLLIIGIVIIVITSVYFFAGPLLAIFLSLIILAILYISKNIWLIHRTSKNRIRIASIGLVISIVGTFSFWTDFFSQVVPQFLNEKFKIHLSYTQDKYLPYGVMLFAIAVIFIVNYFSRDETAMGEHPKAIEEDIPDRNYSERLKTVCAALDSELRNIDIKTNWSNQYFVSLDAEVEVTSNSKKSKRITDLLNAIKNSDDRLFLVIGDPGSGKSVSLRKLTKDLLEETKKTGKIPVYINLKEWQTSYTWTNDNKPTLDELKDFILGYLQSIDIVTSKFFTQFFDKLYDTGRLYFVLDSFDEIPGVLNEEENSEIMNHLSGIFSKFLKGARGELSQGVLASRNFRRPNAYFQSNTEITILPLNEKKIRSVFKLRIIESENIIKDIFINRPDLVVVLKNPFLSSLLIDYIEHNNILPTDLYSMYLSYINNTLNDSKAKLKENKLDAVEVFDYSQKIAKKMYSMNSLEISVDDVFEESSDTNFYKVIDILKFTRIGRLSNKNLFSFSHRRFAEFFYASTLDFQSIQLESIPNDSQERDALVLYCQIASDEIAVSIVEYCFSILRIDPMITQLKTLHTMRFLYEAFVGRKLCLEAYQSELYHAINDQVNVNNNMLKVKNALEFVGLLSPNYIDSIIIKALEIGNYWTNETALKSCRHLGHISSDLESNMRNYISTITLKDLLSRRFNDLYFSLSLSSAFLGLRKLLFYRILDILPTFILMYFPATFALIILLSMARIPSHTYLQHELLFSCITVILDISLVYYYNIFSLFSFFSEINKKNLKNNLKILIPISVIGAIYFINEYIISIYFSNVSSFFAFIIKALFIIFIPFACIAFVIGAWKFLKVIIGIFKELYVYNRIKVYKHMERKHIYNLYFSLHYKFSRSRLLNQFESKVEVVTGDWPSENFLQMTNNGEIIRLAILDEKWLGRQN